MKYTQTDGIVFNGESWRNRIKPISLRLTEDPNGLDVLSISDDAAGLMISVPAEKIREMFNGDK